MTEPDRRPVNRLVAVGTATLAVYVIAVYLFAGRDAGLPALFNLGFYLILLVQTYYSLSFTEAAYRVRCPSDAIISVPLLGLYVVHPWLMARPFWFWLLMAAYFVCAVMKYANWVNRVDDRFFLRRKLLVNCLGVLMCVAITGWLAATTTSLWATATGFALFAGATVYTLKIDPLYRRGELGNGGVAREPLPCEDR